MSQHLDGLEIGDRIDVRGPNGLLVYNGRGKAAAATFMRITDLMMVMTMIMWWFGEGVDDDDDKTHHSNDDDVGD